MGADKDRDAFRDFRDCLELGLLIASWGFDVAKGFVGFKGALGLDGNQSAGARILNSNAILEGGNRCDRCPVRLEIKV